jgi:U3 small nucleolar RNA-associated protein 6
LVKKRSDFEHKILARGSQPVDFARYAAWEISLEKLRQKRCKRLRIKGSSAHAGQARIFLILERGTRKHPGDLGLWMSSLQYAREVKATKKFKTVLTAALRMHPMKAELWLYAAKSTLEDESDMNGARSYMQRGTRFCTRSKELWIEYAKLEMIYLAKIGMRRKILGLDGNQATETEQEIDNAENDHGFTASEDMIRVPNFKAHTIRPRMIDGVKVDDEAVRDPMITPALNGAIPLAIFDDARKHSFFSASVAEDFFNMFASFEQVLCLPKILQHVIDIMLETYSTDSSTHSCFIRQPIIGIDPRNSKFPMALASSLDRLKASKEKVTDRSQLSRKVASWMESILALDDLDPGIRTVLTHTLRKLES